jgi:predicted ester cyclase
VAELLFVGVHIGEYAGVRPTGRRVRVPLAMAFDVDAGLIAAIRVYYSPEAVLAQLSG